MNVSSLENMKIIAEIPAREGSKRVKNKNLRILNGKPLISYAIESVKKSQYINKAFVNTNSLKIGELAVNSGIEYYKRDDRLATDDTKQEEFNYDFIVNTKPDTLIMINPVCPLIDEKDIDNVIEFYMNNNYDSVITVEEVRQQSFCNKRPVNIDLNQILQPTQNIEPILLCNWAITVWNAQKFSYSYEKYGYASFLGNTGFYTLSKIKSIKISYEEDFQLAEYILKTINAPQQPPKYYSEQ
jgi:CMP-N,N'-diacetyllegionaminic acid synthase